MCNTWIPTDKQQASMIGVLHLRARHSCVVKTKSYPCAQHLELDHYSVDFVNVFEAFAKQRRFSKTMRVFAGLVLCCASHYYPADTNCEKILTAAIVMRESMLYRLIYW